MERSLGTDELKAVIRAMDEAAGKAGAKNVRIILCGGLAAIAYGMEGRATLDVDAEIDAGYRIIEKIKKNISVPAELTTDISRWSMIDIPDGYRERAAPLDLAKTKNIRVFVLAPVDLIISKLRVFRDKDIQDALFLIKKFSIGKADIMKASKRAIDQSPPSTEIMRFRKSVNHFVKLAWPHG
ncbi:hypothetical protein BMS3Bbin05_00859 [bacterium BMS3Bbin05]|nr:hypothetical protein BMS3Bbin05_00859 [bacterium BMS3Bbin05]